MNPTEADRADIPWLDQAFFENQAKFPPEDLLPYAGRHIAWSWDGSRILDSADEREQLVEKLIAAGENPHRVVFDYVDIV